MYGEKLGEMAWMDLSVANAEVVSHFYQSVLGWHSEPVSMTLGDEKYHDFVMTSATEPNVFSQASRVSEENTNRGSDEGSNQGTEENIPSPSATASTPKSLVTGICHARGENQDMPAVWLPYFLVKDLDESADKVVGNGGSLVTKVKNVGADRYLVIKDPAGAMAAIYQKA